MSTPKVLIIGCGVAGPVIALLLKTKGYEPIVFEKVRELGDAGASLMMFPNGFDCPHNDSSFQVLTIFRLKVLSKVGLASFVTSSAPHIIQLCDRASYGNDLGVSKLPLKFEDKYGFPGCGVKRTALNLALKDALIAARIPVHEGWKLKEVIEKGDSVVAIAEDGSEVEGCFMIGCDGIKAVSRSLVLKEHGLGQEVADYTGLIQVSRQWWC
jgi:salicylate hydroxylase